MSFKSIRIISVGKPRLSFWKQASDYYLEKLSHWRKIEETIVRDAPPGLDIEHRVEHESRRIASVITPVDIVVCLDEHGKTLTSTSFSSFLTELSSNSSFRPCFIVGGAFGLRLDLLPQTRHCISFGPQTFPHELARVVLLEQLYRAETIARNIPYHHA